MVDYESSASPQTQRFLARKVTYDSSIRGECRSATMRPRQVMGTTGEINFELCDGLLRGDHLHHKIRDRLGHFLDPVRRARGDHHHIALREVVGFAAIDTRPE